MTVILYCLHMKMKRKLIGILVCMLLLTTIPLSAGMTTEKETEPDEEPEGIFGLAWVRGWLLNPREVDNYISGRAIRLRYFEFSGLKTNKGIITLKSVNFRAGIFLDIKYIGALGSLAYVQGFVPGGIDVQE